MEDGDIMILILSQVFGFDTDLIESMVMKRPDTETKLQGVRAIFNNLFDDEVDVEALQQLISTRAKQAMKMFEHYAPSGTYNGKVILTKTTQNLIEFDSNSKFWGLEEVRLLLCSCQVLLNTGIPNPKAQFSWMYSKNQSNIFYWLIFS